MKIPLQNYWERKEKRLFPILTYIPMLCFRTVCPRIDGMLSWYK